jgi:hypothetical protein
MADENNTETWQPPRGKVFKAVVWVLLALIVLSAAAGLVTALLA